MLHARVSRGMCDSLRIDRDQRRSVVLPLATPEELIR